MYKSIAVDQRTYVAIKAAAQAEGVTMASFVQQMMKIPKETREQKLARLGREITTPSVRKPRYKVGQRVTLYPMLTSGNGPRGRGIVTALKNGKYQIQLDYNKLIYQADADRVKPADASIPKRLGTEQWRDDFPTDVVFA